MEEVGNVDGRGIVGQNSGWILQGFTIHEEHSSKRFTVHSVDLFLALEISSTVTGGRENVQLQIIQYCMFYLRYVVTGS